MGHSGIRFASAASTVAALLFLAACSQAGEEEAASGDNVDKEAAQRVCSPPADIPVKITGGKFRMGQDDVYAEEGPIVEISVDGFWIDPHEVTNAQFAEFVEETGYVTMAEKPVDPALFGVPVEQIPPDMLKAGSAMFVAPDFPSTNYSDWWKYTPGASWKKPYGPDGSDYMPNEPVVHLGYEDMEAYARWRRGRIPTEAEWEYAAAAGQEKTTTQPEEANSWQGAFPSYNAKTDGFRTIAPVGCYEANANGLHDMIGNVWEMTADFYVAGHNGKETDNPKGPSENAAFDPQNPGFPSRVIKGGSYLCAPNYCQRYRPAARSGRDPALGASNVGFRLVYDERPSV